MMKNLAGIPVLMAAGGYVAPQLPTGFHASAVARNTAKAIRTWKECHCRLMGTLAPEATRRYLDDYRDRVVYASRGEYVDRQEAARQSQLASRR